ncbi:ATP-binding protein [Saccharopolyspora shandongensis]|uniref:sensor histidine kinase n=1 Tax=Saccharopolyspora shandongensis TaxID=418495 RepID=UPI0034415FDA
MSTRTAVQALDGLDANGLVRIQIPETLPDVLADPGLLERVLANLIGNALHYNPPGRSVLVTASALADHVEVRIIDRGPGVRAEDQEKIFLPFQRLGDRDKNTGVGLALARGLTEAMHGTLTPDETPGGGLTVVLTLPTAESPAIPEQSSAERPAPRGSIR